MNILPVGLPLRAALSIDWARSCRMGFGAASARKMQHQPLWHRRPAYFRKAEWFLMWNRRAPRTRPHPEERRAREQAER